MSRTPETATNQVSVEPGTSSPAIAISKWTPWVWALIGCIILGTSGIVRAVQERRHLVENNYKETCPFPLAELPTKLGGWRLVPGGEKSLDALTIRITGSTSHIMRNYVDDLTGVSLAVLVLFGPAEPVLPHTPEVCYPASGYNQVDDAATRRIKADDGTEAEFRSAIYAKPGGRTMHREEAYHSFRLEGRWSPDVGAGRKFPRRNPGLFKIQISRWVAEGERRNIDEPIEQFLKLLIPEIERRIAASETPAGSPSTVPPKTSMSGFGSAPLGGQARRDDVPPSRGHSGPSSIPPTGRPEGLARESRRLASEDRYPADHADEQDHRHQVEGE